MHDTISKEAFNNLQPVLVIQRDDDGHVVVAIDTQAFDTPAVWGIIVADLAQHIANAYEQDGLSGAAVLAEIRQILLAELGSPTDKARALQWETDA